MTASDSSLASNALLSAARKLRTALALSETGVAMKRAQLRRTNHDADGDEIDRRLAEWLRTRPGAPDGDAEGVAGQLR
ncbi:MAG: hypothetical protein QM612_07430 [Thermomonas sp.]|uniref:hypothetical protein n=1 Tax=Thermomonas sp. TaxID=1971895 RepID=UPI0039E2B789